MGVGLKQIIYCNVEVYNYRFLFMFMFVVCYCYFCFFQKDDENDSKTWLIDCLNDSQCGNGEFCENFECVTVDIEINLTSPTDNNQTINN